MLAGIQISESLASQRPYQATTVESAEKADAAQWHATLGRVIGTTDPLLSIIGRLFQYAWFGDFVRRLHRCLSLLSEVLGEARLMDRLQRSGSWPVLLSCGNMERCWGGEFSHYFGYGDVRRGFYPSLMSRTWIRWPVDFPRVIPAQSKLGKAQPTCE